MADSDKDILITPNKSQTTYPEISFVGQANAPIALRVLDDNTLSFEGSAGQLFSLNNNLSTGSIFSANDISGIPSISVDASGRIDLAPYNGFVNIGVNTNNTDKQLAITGEMHITSPVGSLTPAAIHFGESGTVTGTGGIYLGYDGPNYADNSNYWFVRNGLNTNILSVTYGGGVGIQTINPQTKLHIIGGHIDSSFRLSYDRNTNVGSHGGTGYNTMHFWVSEPGVNWDGGGIGLNVTNRYTQLYPTQATDDSLNYFPRLNTQLGQAYIRFYPGSTITNYSTQGYIGFTTTDTTGNTFSNQVLIQQGTLNVGGATPNTSYKLNVSGTTLSTAMYLNGTGAYPLDINGSSNAKIVLRGSASPYIRWRENNTDRAYIQFNATYDALLIRNQQGAYTDFMGNTTNPVGIRFRTSNGTIRGYVYATSANNVGFLDSGGSWAIRHINDSGTYFYTDGQTEELRVGRDIVSGGYGTVQTSTYRNNYGGYSISGRHVFMGNSTTTCGIYNDANDHWLLRCVHASSVYLYYNNNIRLATSSAGVSVTGLLTASSYVGGVLNSTSNSSFTVDANLYHFIRWEASFTATREMTIDNMSVGQKITIFVRNTNATTRTLRIRLRSGTSGTTYYPVISRSGAGSLSTATNTNFSYAANRCATWVIYCVSTTQYYGFIN